MKNPREVKDFRFKDYRKGSQKRKAVNIDFYPEGGNLIEGLTSTVAFRITDKTGKTISASGEIRSPEGELLTVFSTIHQGMGSFSYTPNGQKNKVVIHYDKREYTFPMPESLQQGYVMQINNFLHSSALVRIEKSPSLPSQTLGLTVMCRGEISVFETVETGSEPSVIKIPKESLQSGVNQITLFDSRGEVFADRQLFIHPQTDEAVSVKVISDKNTYEPREKIKLDFEVSGGQASVLSVAVRDAGTTMITADAGNILSNMLLSSDLKGFIENPGYYFSTDTPDKMQALDLLLLVHGWKRYEWKPMAGVQTFHLRHPIEKGLLIYGQVVGKANEIHLIMGEEDKIMDGIAPVDSVNSFSIYAEDFWGSWLLTMTAPGLKDVYKNIRLNRWFSPPPKSYFPDEIQAGNPDLQYSQQADSLEYSIISPVTTDTDSIDREYEIDEGKGAGKERGKDLIYNVAQEVEEWLDTGRKYCPDIVHEYLIEKNSGYLCKSLDPNMPVDNNIDYAYRPFFRNYRIVMMYVVNGQPRVPYEWDRDRGQLKTVRKNILEVEKIVILPWKKETLGNRFKVSVYHPVHIYPLKNYRINAQLMHDVRQTLFEGYSQAQEFTSGIYMPGVREHYRTLYWNPSLSSDEQGKASIEFYNTQFGRKIEVDACGVTGKGNLICKKYL
jgi:hypothetical protein